jgi:hypothetical protein
MRKHRGKTIYLISGAAVHRLRARPLPGVSAASAAVGVQKIIFDAKAEPELFAPGSSRPSPRRRAASCCMRCAHAGRGPAPAGEGGGIKALSVLNGEPIPDNGTIFAHDRREQCSGAGCFSEIEDWAGTVNMSTRCRA